MRSVPETPVALSGPEVSILVAQMPAEPIQPEGMPVEPFPYPGNNPPDDDGPKTGGDRGPEKSPVEKPAENKSLIKEQMIIEPGPEFERGGKDMP